MRRARESTAVGHTTPPVVVNTMDPIADHPSLGKLRDVRAKRIAKRARGKHHARVKVDVEVKSGDAS